MVGGGDDGRGWKRSGRHDTHEAVKVDDEDKCNDIDKKVERMFSFFFTLSQMRPARLAYSSSDCIKEELC